MLLLLTGIYYSKMSFKDVKLPASAIADLYRHSLVVLDEVPPVPFPKTKEAVADTPAEQDSPTAVMVEPTSAAPEETAPLLPTIRYMGSFKQQVSIVLADAAQEHIAPADWELLQKLIAAVKLSLDDIAIINVANQPAASQLWQLMPARAVLMFGVRSNDIGIPFYRPDFQVQHWNNAYFMGAPPLAAFQGLDSPELKARKRELWDGLQKVFLGK
jgi:hypothetical protein